MAGCFCLDLSSCTGWAHGGLPDRPRTPMEMAAEKPPQPLSGIKHFKGDIGASLAEFQTWLDERFDQLRPAGVVYESPILPEKTTPATVLKLMSLAGILLMTCHRRKVRWVRQIQPSAMKKHVCGSGRPGKRGVIDAVRSWGWEPIDDNHADAMGLFFMAGGLYAAERARAV